MKKFKLPKINLSGFKFKSDTIQEIVVLAGFLMLLKGLFDIYPPAMWVLGGIWLMIPGKGRVR